MMRPWLLALFLMVIGGAYLVRAQDDAQPEPGTAEPETHHNTTVAEPESTPEAAAPETTPTSTAHMSLPFISLVLASIALVVSL